MTRRQVLLERLMRLEHEVGQICDELWGRRPSITPVYFVSRDGVARPAADWAAAVRHTRLSEFVRQPTHTTSDEIN